MSNQPNRVSVPGLFWGTALVLVVAYAGFVLLLWRVGVFDFPETDPAAEVLAAVIGLLGALFAAILTFAGVLLKHSVDERNLALKEEAEERLRLETFIQAAQLLATDTGTKAPPTQQAAALFALADLNHLQFALALLREMWREGAVSPTSACWLIDRCFRSNDHDLQELAAEVLWENARTLTTSAECFDWPQVIFKSWPSHLGQSAGFSILRALFRCLYSRPATAWQLGCLADAIVMLAEARGTDESVLVRSDATLLLDVLRGQLRKGMRLFLAGGGMLDLEQLYSESDLQEATGNASVQGREMANELREWAKGTAPAPSASRPPDP